ncbi:MAG: 2-phosphosulfolactate phosphatase [Chlamydiales bacterium]|jgi:2-phosphosulfolactate phosphatase
MADYSTQHSHLLIEKVYTSKCVSEDFVVVIDVLRAFTTAAYAFAAGAEKILLVKEVEEAFALKEENPDFLLIGEEKGLPCQGFDYGNSPIQFTERNVAGRTLVQRTSCGTKGVVGAIDSRIILVSSFVVAGGTLERIRCLLPNKVTFVMTGGSDGDEDLALADYLGESLIQGGGDPTPYLRRVVNSPGGRSFVDKTNGNFPRKDLEAAVLLDFFPFSLEVFKEDIGIVLRPTQSDGATYVCHK